MQKKSPRNKTLTLTKQQENLLASQAVVLNKKVNIQNIKDKIIWQNMYDAIDFLPDNCVDLMIVDPPYNLNKNFGNSYFKIMPEDKYAEWLDSWLKKTARILKNNASVYICTDWKSSISVPFVAGKYFVLQNRISWEREKGRGAKNNWKNCLEDIWFFSKSQQYTFNIDAVKVLRPVLAPYKDNKGKCYVLVR